MVEYHTSLRFVELRKQDLDYTPVKKARTHWTTIARFLYNLAFWVFLVPFFTDVDYAVGFIAFSIVLLVRFVSNAVTNNVLDLSPAQYDVHAFRIP